MECELKGLEAAVADEVDTQCAAHEQSFSRFVEELGLMSKELSSLNDRAKVKRNNADVFASAQKLKESGLALRRRFDWVVDEVGNWSRLQLVLQLKSDVVLDSVCVKRRDIEASLADSLVLSRTFSESPPDKTGVVGVERPLEVNIYKSQIGNGLSGSFLQHNHPSKNTIDSLAKLGSPKLSLGLGNKLANVCLANKGQHDPSRVSEGQSGLNNREVKPFELGDSHLHGVGVKGVEAVTTQGKWSSNSDRKRSFLDRKPEESLKKRNSLFESVKLFSDNHPPVQQLSDRKVFGSGADSGVHKGVTSGKPASIDSAKKDQRTVNISNLQIDSTKFRKIVYHYINKNTNADSFVFKNNVFATDPLTLLAEIFTQPSSVKLTFDLKDNYFQNSVKDASAQVETLKSRRVVVII